MSLFAQNLQIFLKFFCRFYGNITSLLNRKDRHTAMDFAIIKTTIGDVFECLLQNTSTISKHASFIYMRMKNDLSFILDSDMCLYEHQSTYNPNMPLRGLLYFADLLQQFVTENRIGI